MADPPPPPPGDAQPPALAPPPPCFSINRVSFAGREGVPILLQNENGPCPLLAIINALLLSGRLELGAGATEVPQDRLIQLLAGFILDRAARLEAAHGDELGHAVVASNLEAALEKINKLATGIDVNVHFTGPRAFEFTDEVALFDLAGVPLVHGWVMGTDDPAAALLLGGGATSYNAAVALAVEASGDEAEKAAPPPPPPRSLLDEDWPPPGGGGATCTTAPSAPPAALAGLDGVASSDLADAVEASLRLDGEAAAAHPEVAALVAAAVAKAGGGGGTSSSSSTPVPQPPAHQPARAARAAAAASFLARTATQLTPAGLVALHDPAAGGLSPGELASLFRGSHFATAYARPRPPDPLLPGDVGGGVFTLVTDVGYRGRGVVWERLEGVSGDTTLVGADFRPPPVEGGGDGSRHAATDSASAAAAAPVSGDADADLALAMRLQAEEDAAAVAARERVRQQRAAAAQQEQQQQQQQQPPLRRPGSSGLLGFGSGRRPGSGGGRVEDKCVVM